MKISWLKKIVANYQVKLFMLVFAIFIWLYVSSQDTYEYAYPVKIVPVKVKQNYLVVNNYPKEALVKFRGKGRSLLALRGADKSIPLNLSRFRRRAIFRLRPEMVHIPSGLSVDVLEVISPDTVIIELEKRLERKVPVISALNIQLQPGYTIVGGIKLDPAQVLVSGPGSVVDTLKSLRTNPLFFNHVRSNLSGKVRVEVPPGLHLTISPEYVTYFVNVQQLGEKVIHDIPVTLIHAPRKKKLRVIPSTISVTIEGGVDLLNSIQAKDIHVYIDYRQKNQKGNDYRAIIELPPETRFSDAFPHTFKIIAEK